MECGDDQDEDDIISRFGSREMAKEIRLNTQRNKSGIRLRAFVSQWQWCSQVEFNSFHLVILIEERWERNQSVEERSINGQSIGCQLQTGNQKVVFFTSVCVSKINTHTHPQLCLCVCWYFRRVGVGGGRGRRRGRPTKIFAPPEVGAVSKRRRKEERKRRRCVRERQEQWVEKRKQTGWEKGRICDVEE